MSIQRQLRRGTTSQINAMTPAAGELLMDTTRNALVLGNGSQLGGFPLPSLNAQGWVGIGIAPNCPLQVSQGQYDPSATINLVTLTSSLGLTGDNSNAQVTLAINSSTVTVPLGKTMTGSMSAIRLDAFVNTLTFAGTLNSQYAIWTRAGILSSASTGTITIATALRAEPRNDVAGATIIGLYGVYVSPSTIAGNGSTFAGVCVAPYSMTGTYTSRYDFYGGNTGANNYFAGAVGIGVTDPQTYKAYVRQSSTGLGALRCDNQSAATGTVVVCNLDTTGNNVFVNFYTENPTAVLRGSINYNRTGGVVAYNTTSDQRIKELIADDYDYGAVIDAVEPHHYRRTDIVAENFGFFAQELHAAVPTAVSQGSDDDLGPGDEGFVPWQVDNSQLVPYLWAEVRALRSRIAALEPA